MRIMRPAPFLLAISFAGCAHAAHPGGSATSAEASAAADGQIVDRQVPREPFAAQDLTLEAGLLPPMPTALTSFGAASDGTYLYVVGGYHGVPHRYSREGQRAAVQRLPIDGSGAWETIAELPEGAQGLDVVHYRGRLCRFGGSIATNSDGEPTDMRSSQAASCFDLKTRRWSALPDLPAGRSSHAVTRVGSKVYVAGGWALLGAPSKSRWHKEVLVLDLENPDAGWASAAAPMTRRAVGVVASGSKVVVVGGLTPDGKMSREVDVYDTLKGTWSKGPELPEDAFGVAVAGMEDGTVVASARSGRLLRWTPGAAKWEPSGSLAFGRFFHQLVPATNTKLIAIGGISGMHAEGRTRHVEVVELSPAHAQHVVWSMRHHGVAKNRQAVFVRGDYLYFFGGNNSLEQHDFAEHNFVAEGLRIHLPSMTTERLGDFPAPRQSMVVVNEGEAIYAVGGFGFEPGGAVTQADVFAYDPDTDVWTPSGALPLSRTQFGAFSDGEDLWVLGGLHYDPTKQGEAAFDHRLDILAGPPGRLSTIEAPLPAPRRAFAGALYQGSYYMVGGMQGGFQLVATCARFDVQARSFADLPCPGAPRLSGSLVPLGDRLLLVGGSMGGTGEDLEVSNAIEAFDPAAQAWTRLHSELPFSTRHAHVLTYGERLLVVSTHNEEGRVRIALVDPRPELRSRPLPVAKAAAAGSALSALEPVGRHDPSNP